LKNNSRKEKEKTFYAAKYDRMFRTFVDDNDYHLMEALLSTCLDKEVKIVKYLKTELSVKKSVEKVKRLDILVKADGEYVNLELNTLFDTTIKVRNFIYFSSFYSENTNLGDSYDYKTPFIHIDLSYRMSLNEPAKATYCMYSKEADANYVDNFKIIVFNMDKIMKFWYDKNVKEIDKYKLLIMLDLKKDELETLSKDDRLVNEYKEEVTKLNENYDFIAPLSLEEDAIAVENTRIKIAEEKGIEQGIEQGAQEKEIAIAKNMLNMNMSLEIISQATGLSKEEIKNINMDNNS
jgi:predicted transposase/invertase (TIGR01784 family)